MRRSVEATCVQGKQHNAGNASYWLYLCIRSSSSRVRRSNISICKRKQNLTEILLNAPDRSRALLCSNNLYETDVQFVMTWIFFFCHFDFPNKTRQNKEGNSQQRLDMLHATLSLSAKYFRDSTISQSFGKFNTQTISKEIECVIVKEYCVEIIN